ncbi:Octanoyltransferase [Planctomycetes bacterium Pla163]|uniref:Octanoyltransferase n=1 Tax=Rohdeia mirabilis TaxID=2528008 RepID=A0A518D410_9BACT|nr:Octanoyltransferase [Planctomycetes bacterium Pla163]
MSAEPQRELEVLHLGRVDYLTAHRLQQERLARRIAGEVPDGLLLLEHDEVVTLGRGESISAADRSALEARGVELIDVERGGEATWHGPGQLVAYPIIELREGERDLHRYLRTLEQVVIDVLAGLGIEGSRKDGLTGVWIDEQKVSSIGVAVRRWTTWHGVSLDVSNSLETFGAFHACGLEPGIMTRVVDRAQVPTDDPLLANAFARAFATRFGRRPVE